MALKWIQSTHGPIERCQVAPGLSLYVTLSMTERGIWKASVFGTMLKHSFSNAIDAKDAAEATAKTVLKRAMANIEK